ncbi:MAG: class II aldolase [Alteromonadaceae bacterium]|nr:class II aldolase [Alteromonadaceae bacterium]
MDIPTPDLAGKISPEEWQMRIDLAACYKLLVLHQWDDLIYTHVSAKVPGTEHFLINPFGLTFSEVNASNLVKIDIDGNIIQEDCPFAINPAGFTIHSAVHGARDDATCVIHIHQDDAIAVASQKDGLLPLSQYAAFALASMAYHGYEGLAVDEGECKRLQEDLGDANFMLLPNHGALTVGQTIGDAFMHMYDLIRACQIQLKMQQSGAELIYLPEHIVPNIKAQANIVHTGQTGGQKAWPAMLRRVKAVFPDFDQ